MDSTMLRAPQFMFYFWNWTFQTQVMTIGCPPPPGCCGGSSRPWSCPSAFEYDSPLSPTGATEPDPVGPNQSPPSTQPHKGLRVPRGTWTRGSDRVQVRRDERLWSESRVPVSLHGVARRLSALRHCHQVLPNAPVLFQYGENELFITWLPTITLRFLTVVSLLINTLSLCPIVWGINFDCCQLTELTCVFLSFCRARFWKPDTALVTSRASFTRYMCILCTV